MCKKWIITATSVSLLTLSACNEAYNAPERMTAVDIDAQTSVSDDGAPKAEFGFYQAMEAGPDPFGQNAPSAKSKVPQTGSEPKNSKPDLQPAKPVQQIAYTYGYGFQIDGDNIPKLQDAHLALCEGMKEKCRVLKSSQASADSWDGYGELQLQVAAHNAATFADAITAPAEELGGELISSVRDGEDLSEKIIDGKARLASRLILRDKLTGILRRNTGSVDELVKAERAIADVNEEIDATRSKLKRFSTRIRFSDVQIEYQPHYGESQLGFTRPVATAFRSIGTTLGTSIGFMIYALTALLPIALLVLGLRWVLHRFGLRLRFWKKGKDTAAP